MPLGSRASRRLSQGRAVALIAVAAAAVVVGQRQAHAQDPEPAAAPTSTAAPSSFPTTDTAPVATEPLPPAPPPLTYTPPQGWTTRHSPDDLPELPPLPPRRPSHTHVFLNPGYLLSLSPGVASRTTETNGKTTTTDIATGHGVELSVSIWPAGSMVNYGPFMQVQRYFSYNGNHNRYALGGQIAWLMFGLEAGFAYRGADDFRSGTTMLHLGPFLSMAFMNIGARFGIPLQSGTEARPAHRAEGSFVLSFKVPLHLL